MKCRVCNHEIEEMEDFDFTDDFETVEIIVFCHKCKKFYDVEMTITKFTEVNKEFIKPCLEGEREI